VTTERSDEQLALEAAGGSREAFEEIVSRFGAAVRGVIEKQVEDYHLAFDLAQEVWVKVFRALPRWQPTGSFRSWVFSVTLNHVRDAKRSKARSRIVYLDEFRVPPSAPKSSDPRGRIEEHAAITTALANVPEPYRTAVFLVDVNGLSYEEAAGSLSCAVGTVKSRVNRGRFAFKDLYLRQEGDVRDPARVSESRGASP
jgi:RNA polymerase sigma-70 factor, ECF subfamily